MILRTAGFICVIIPRHLHKHDPCKMVIWILRSCLCLARFPAEIVTLGYSESVISWAGEFNYIVKFQYIITVPYTWISQTCCSSKPSRVGQWYNFVLAVLWWPACTVKLMKGNQTKQVETEWLLSWAYGLIFSSCCKYFNHFRLLPVVVIAPLIHHGEEKIQGTTTCMRWDREKKREQSNTYQLNT